ncbi:hypothetical protein KF947_19215 [Halomonas sp. FeN2]|uniref:hypothetical protein n=1 Tax=Halomonas sp. FeN2 TaxID=2832500 RepID=UPI000C6B2847|nr:MULTISPECIES: hypothetical protein [unclassified Halomonas]MBF57557.1 hypothetical protein [Halomonas sp.]UBR49433.1 hypothetical protein KF947_19215 [Halomonas sp. FeN2]|tara:strand:- start:125 stop:478 length:354 start_codon:yes stop_codon:yes gene_type:complete
MSFDNQKDQLITQLIRETISGHVRWSARTPPYSLNQATESYVPLYLETTYKETRIGIYEIRDKHFTDVDEFYWAENLGFCIVLEPEVVVWQIEEYSPALKELFNMARYHASGISNLL